MRRKIKSARPPYELVVSKVKESTKVSGTLRSPLLDPSLNPGAKVNVFVAGTKGAKGELELSEFVKASLAEYVSSQAAIKKALEEAFRGGKAGPRARAALKNGNLWSSARIEAVAFEEKRVLDKAALAAWKKFMPKIDTSRLRKNSDKPSTRSRFTIQMMVDWDEEHNQALVTFRNGAIASLDF